MMTLTKPNPNKPVFMLYPKMLERINKGLCTECEQPMKEEDYKDELSKREYSISGMCQKCPDSFFK